jgi:nicotinamide-nucleotide amidase
VESDSQLEELAARVGAKLRAAGQRLVTAESCTGGWIAKLLTDIPGSSQWYECGYVTYSNFAKMRDLGVTARTLESFGAVSDESVREMALGALRVAGADVALAVTGIAGPDGATPGKPIGTVWFCAAQRQAAGEPGAGGPIVEQQLFGGDRDSVRRRAAQYALALVLRLELAPRLESSARAGPG